MLGNDFPQVLETELAAHYQVVHDHKSADKVIAWLYSLDEQELSNGES